MKHQSNMTSKGQVTVPKDIRDALGLKPGQRVRFEMDADGNARIVKASAEAGTEAYLHRVQEAQKKFGGRDRFGGMDGLTFQRWIRGDGPEV
jgi:AbrB family looped-hinge helix DNA binding protein